jgi:valyl-tRNA synthetase
VPFPLWICQSCDSVVLARNEQLPVDPSVDPPPVSSCPDCGSSELAPESDIMDTWMTSSCTPFINIRWREGDSRVERFKKVAQEEVAEYLMDLRPQAHDIIRTWAYYTVVKSVLNAEAVPWRTAMISGHVLHPDRAKISKSKGESGAAPSEVVEERSADCTRYWATCGRLGTDTLFAEEGFDAGHRLVVKLWNASKFAISRLSDYDPTGPRELRMIDRWLLARAAQAVDRATSNLTKCEYHGAVEAVESLFWRDLCDNYIEIVKRRLYGDAGYDDAVRRGAQHALYEVLLAVLKMLAPVMPHVTEEIFMSYFAEREGDESIHVSRWPEPAAQWRDAAAAEVGETALHVIEGMRKIKSESKVSVAAPVKALSVFCDDQVWGSLGAFEPELRDVSNAERVERAERGGPGFVQTGIAGILVGAELAEA